MTTYAEDARFGVNDTFSAVLPLSYVHAVHESGGRAVLITPDAPDTDVLDGLDGIMFTGGSDVDPALYGEPPHPATKVKPQRDTAELLLLRAAVEADLPVLGVCRGMQLMAVAYGGRLHQHLPEVLGHEGHRPERRASANGRGPKFAHHPVRLRPGSRAHAILGDELVVNSYHHQGVRDPGGLTPVGWCPGDDLVEVVEDPSRTFVLGVQWHPEDTDDFRVFEAFVETANARKMALR
ncbi:gamma-glutamyl-gamma-aminobutyrate hydrolase family protein [Phytohabitans sp. ZYX-F-186]|uniref:Gamma-glutamyl-gamma-aminobutyrate hydrolase family protein n=1 Tax=Phytohabitans maris TaxID=3071409 RepID=A0ABU0ZJV2_9ACTN|nr:gamma-glutamyl-gamma-aminobutyrate hydrolase family protein [Phytohabitans sp. ZYX-F-186]MDQ7907315.1 gamma-glutamyl-gamma-aminobutyrate hydrolase family protein [Phytohabitans sp. ZYX-F-186]